MMQNAVRLAALLALSAAAAPAYTVSVSSDPPGAEVWASPVDQPIIYRKGVTPCEVTLAEAGAPHVILLRKTGHFDAYREVAADASLSVTLASLDDPAAWAQLPGVARRHYDREKDEPALGMQIGIGGEARPIESLPPFVDSLDQWAPDGSAFMANGDVWSDRARDLGLVKRGEERSVADIWWCPLQGEPRLLWRWTSEPEVMARFIMTGDFAPDPRWLAFSAAVGDCEHVRLACTVEEGSRPIATEDGVTIYGPFFSPTGRLIGCVREERAEDPWSPEGPPGDLQVMHFNGSGRRTVARNIDWRYDLTFSPDERYVAFVDSEGRACVAPVRGGDTRAVIADRHWRATRRPVWSPDGRRLAVTCELGREERRNRGGSAVRAVCWADLDGGGRGFIRACELIGWCDENALIVSMSGYEVERGFEYARVGIIDLEGRLTKMLLEPDRTEGPPGPLPELAPTIPTGGEQ